MSRREHGDETIAWPGLVDFFSLGMVIMLVLFVVMAVGWSREHREYQEAVARYEKEKEDLAAKLQQGKIWAEQVRRELREIEAELVKEGALVRSDITVATEGPPRLAIRTFRGQQVQFDVLRYDLQPSDRERLEAAARSLADVTRSHGNSRLARYVIEIWGEADPRPLPSSSVPPRNNRELSALRAARVASILVDGGIKKDQLRILGLGANAPESEGKLRPGETDEERDRRLAKYRTVRINIVAEALPSGGGGH